MKDLIQYQIEHSEIMTSRVLFMQDGRTNGIPNAQPVKDKIFMLEFQQKLKNYPKTQLTTIIIT